jgi:hypothetical protein
MRPVLSVLALTCSLMACGRAGDRHEARGASAAAAEPAPSGRGRGVPSLKDPKDLLVVVDVVRLEGPAVRVEGWAFADVPERDARGSEFYVVLRAKDASRRLFPASPVPRPDVARFYGNPRLEPCGFFAEIPTAGLREGTYEVGVYVRTKDGGEGLQISDKSVVLE